MFTNLTTHHDLYGKMVYFGSGAEFGKHRDVIKVSEENFGEIIPTDMYVYNAKLGKSTPKCIQFSLICWYFW